MASSESKDKLPFFIPNLLRGMKTFITADTEFISSSSFDKYCELFSTNEEGLPNYMYESNVASILPISQEKLDQIWQIQEERVKKYAADKQDEVDSDSKSKFQKNNNDKKVMEILEKSRAYFRKECPVVQPYKTQMSKEEHELYIYCFLKFSMHTPTASEERLHKNYLALQSRVYEEQSEFMNFSFKVAQLQLEAYNKVPKPINDYVDAHIKHRLSRVKQYPSLYVTEQNLPLRPHNAKDQHKNIYFKHKGHLLSIGHIPLIQIPHYEDKHVIIPHDQQVFYKSPPNIDDKHSSLEFIYKTPVSQDPNAEYLAIQHNADFVMASSAFKKIASNVYPPFDNIWDIPLTIKTCEIKDTKGNAVKKRIVFIDKPFIKKDWNPLEKKQLFNKKSIIADFRLDISHGSHKMNPLPIFKYATFETQETSESRDSDQRHKPTAQYDDDIFDMFVTNDLETFGSDELIVNVTPKSKKRKNQEEEAPEPSTQSKKNSKDKPIEVNVKESSTIGNNDLQKSDGKAKGLLDNLLDSQEVLLHAQETNASNSPDTSKNRPWSNSLTTDWAFHKESKLCPPNSTVNYHYHVFEFGHNNNPQASIGSGTEFPILKVIVRSSYHGITKPVKLKKKFKYDVSQNIPGYPSYTWSKVYSIYPKLENQAYFGCEINNLLEITEQWSELIVRPLTNLLQVRLNEDSGNVMLMEEKDLNGILKEGAQTHVGFHPSVPLAALYVIFNALRTQASGQYIMHHDAKTGAFINLMKELKSNLNYNHTTVNLYDMYTPDQIKSKFYTTSPWMAIDTHVLTPFHLKHRKIPATFPTGLNKKNMSKAWKKQLKAKAEQKMKIEGFRP